MTAKTNSTYYVIYFSKGGKMHVAGRLFHNYEQAASYAGTIANEYKPVVTKGVVK